MSDSMVPRKAPELEALDKKLLVAAAQLEADVAADLRAPWWQLAGAAPMLAQAETMPALELVRVGMHAHGVLHITQQ